MIALYRSSAHSTLSLHGHQAVTYDTWEHLLTEAGGAHVVVLAWHNLNADTPRYLAKLRRAAPLTPIVLVTRADPDNAAMLAHVLVDAVVWEHEGDSRLLAEIARFAHGPWLTRLLTEALASAEHVPDSVARATMVALTTEPPIGSVKRWAYLQQCTPRAVQKMFKAHLTEPIPPRAFPELVRRVKVPIAGEQTSAATAARKILDLLGIRASIGPPTG